MSLFYKEDDKNNKSGMIMSVALCAFGAIAGFERGTWWSITLGVLAGLGAVCTLILMFKKSE